MDCGELGDDQWGTSEGAGCGGSAIGAWGNASGGWPLAALIGFATGFRIRHHPSPARLACPSQSVSRTGSTTDP
jgi:hypothetical protein